MKAKFQNFLVIYSAVLSTAFAVAVLTGAAPPHRQAFDEIQVHRLQVTAEGTPSIEFLDDKRKPVGKLTPEVAPVDKH